MEKLVKNVKEVLKDDPLASIIGVCECNKCNKEILVNMGFHSGFDAHLDGIIVKDCPFCNHTENIYQEDVNITDYGFMESKKYYSWFFDEYKKNN
tara:strand:+ start:1203 stop:1487 length:285 start_codon:yes stop_codon:yes gene_type:complete